MSSYFERPMIVTVEELESAHKAVCEVVHLVQKLRALSRACEQMTRPTPEEFASIGTTSVALKEAVELAKAALEPVRAHFVRVQDPGKSVELHWLIEASAHDLALVLGKKLAKAPWANKEFAARYEAEAGPDSGRLDGQMEDKAFHWVYEQFSRINSGEKDDDDTRLLRLLDIEFQRARPFWPALPSDLTSLQKQVIRLFGRNSGTRYTQNQLGQKLVPKKFPVSGDLKDALADLVARGVLGNKRPHGYYLEEAP